MIFLVVKLWLQIANTKYKDNMEKPIAPKTLIIKEGQNLFIR